MNVSNESTKCWQVYQTNLFYVMFVYHLCGSLAVMLAAATVSSSPLPSSGLLDEPGAELALVDPHILESGWGRYADVFAVKPTNSDKVI